MVEKKKASGAKGVSKLVGKRVSIRVRDEFTKRPVDIGGCTVAGIDPRFGMYEIERGDGSRTWYNMRDVARIKEVAAKEDEA